MLITDMAAFMQFDSLLPELLVTGTSMLISAIFGIFVANWMTSCVDKMNEAAVFDSLLF